MKELTPSLTAIILTESQVELLSSTGLSVEFQVRLSKKVSEFYFLPVVFEQIEGRKFYIHNIQDLPTDLRDKLVPPAKTPDQQLEDVLNKLNLGTISAEQAKTKIKSILQ